MLTPLENLHYAIGEMAYAMARVDGKVQLEERKKFHDIIESELKNKEYSFDISAIIFQIMDKDKQDSKTAYIWGMNQIRTNSHYLSPGLKKKFMNVIEKVAEAYPPVTREEQDLIDKFKKELEPINGDPVYYNQE